MIERNIAPTATNAATEAPVVVLTGPRQSGKSTFCRHHFPHLPLVSLEDPDQRAFAREDPRAFLQQYTDGAVFDEAQRVPDLMSYLQGMVDADPRPGRFVLTGSQNFALLASITQSLAGRVALLKLLPCSYDEMCRFDTAPTTLLEVLLQGGYPRILDRKLNLSRWCRNYVNTYLERDVRQLLNVTDLATFQTFLSLCAGRSGQVINLSSLGADAGLSHNTVKAWLGVLEASYIIHRVQPYHGNLRKRLVKSPVLYFLDTGLLCHLLDIETTTQLRKHPLRGAIFETWVASEILKARWHRDAPGKVLFYRDLKGHEVDIVVERAGQLQAVECKSGQTVVSDFFDGLTQFERALTNQTTVELVDKLVVYGGNAPQQRQAGQVLPWSSVPNFNWLLQNPA